jgi:endoglucanase
MLALHPAPGALYHQVADDRDHWGWRLPPDEEADYGWGQGKARVVYFADGQPQGLGQYKSESTGVANLAGRYAAAMALAHRVFQAFPEHRPFARRCLQAGVEVYRLGRAREGVQQGNSYGAPYRYAETTWADDMEWGAAELYRETGEAAYLRDATRYATLAATDGWMGRTSAGHYQFYPFVNAGHFALYAVAGPALRRTLSGYYREGIEACRRAGDGNPYGLGAPFLWCSNNLVTALATQVRLYERMSGDHRYRAFGAAQRDWLLGRNPWGTSMLTGIPDGGVYPRDVHLQTTKLTGRPIRGGLVDGPVAEAVFRSLKGLEIRLPDPLADFQDARAVYHDGIGDYSTNEPTMDGTASAVLLWALEAAANDADAGVR